jgi:hypothetical protein
LHLAHTASSHTFAFAMPGKKQSGKGNSQRRNGGNEGGQHNVGGSQPSEDVPASAGGNTSPFPADNNADQPGEIVDTVPSQEDNADEGPSNGVGGGGNILPALLAEVLAEQAAQEDDGLPNNMTGKVIRRGQDAVARVRQGVDHHASAGTLLFYISLLSAFIDDNQRFNPAAGLRSRFNMLMAEANRLRNSLQTWHRLGLDGARHHPDFDGTLRRSLSDSARFERECAREARKREKEKKEKQERNSARKARRAAAKEREEKERVEREERRRKAEERAEKERVEREKRLAEERRVAEEEMERMLADLRSRANKTIQHLRHVDGSPDSKSSEDDEGTSDSVSSVDDEGPSDSDSSVDDERPWDSESSDDDEGPSAPVHDPARKWLICQPAVQTVSSDPVSKGGRGFKGRLSSEARKKNRKAAKSTRPESDDEERNGDNGDDDFGDDE